MTDERIARKLMLRDGFDDDWYYSLKKMPANQVSAHVFETIKRYEAEAEQFLADIIPPLTLIGDEEIKQILKGSNLREFSVEPGVVDLIKNIIALVRLAQLAHSRKELGIDQKTIEAVK